MKSTENVQTSAAQDKLNKKLNRKKNKDKTKEVSEEEQLKSKNTEIKSQSSSEIKPLYITKEDKNPNNSSPLFSIPSILFRSIRDYLFVTNSTLIQITPLPRKSNKQNN